MKSKAPLFMMEQMVMILVFAIAAAICLQAFVRSERISEDNENRDWAVQQCQSAAECIQNTAGDLTAVAELLELSWTEDTLLGYYDKDFEQTDVEDAFCLRAWREDSAVPGLGKARVEMTDTASGDALFALDITWQEVDADA